MTLGATSSSPPPRPWQAVASAMTLSNLKVRAIVIQVVVVATVFAAVWFLIGTTKRNLDLRGIATGFGFLSRQAGFPIGESLLPYSPTDVYGRALLIGLLNTVKVTLIGIFFATILGTAVGIARLSKNWLLSRLSAAYVEVTRDVPLLLQLLFWYSVLQGLPPAREALSPLPGTFLSNRGLYLPSVGFDSDHVAAVFLLLLAAAVFVKGAGLSRSGRSKILIGAGVTATVAGIILGARAGLPTVEQPILSGFNFRGGSYITPEFFALLFGLVFYTTAFIAEIVRAGITAIGKGQWEAGFALGLTRTQILRKIVIPQALRIIVPPLTSQYVNLTKNSSLAVAIGYQEIVSVANTSLNQTGQAIEVIGLIMAAYLTVSLSISLFMNWYDRKIQLKGR